MIGAKSKTYDWSDFARGMSSSNFAQDGGFAAGPSSTTTGSDLSIVNLTVTPGVLNFPAGETDKSTNLTGQIIGSCEDPAAVAARLFVSSDSSQDGRFFSCDTSGTLTARGSVDSGANYVTGKTDIIGYKGEAYVTNNTYIVRWQQPATFNVTFYSFSDAFAPHPALVFEDNAFYGDGNELLRQTSAGGAPAVILTLPTDQVIVALGIDPGSGKMLISVVNEYNVSDTINSQPRVLYYDGFSNKAAKVVLVDDMVEAFCPVGGTVFVGYGSRLGYWNGAGITFVRQLKVSADNAELPYKHRMTNIGNILYVVERNRIIAYGKVLGGASNAFWYTYQNLAAGTPILTFVTNLGNKYLAYSFATSKFYLTDTTSTSSPGGGIFLPRMEFPRPVTFNNVVINYAEAVPTDGANFARVVLITDQGNFALKDLSNTVANQYEFETPYPSITTRTMQVVYSVSNSKYAPVNRLTVFWNEYD